MPSDARRYVDDVPDAVVARLRDVCLALPDAYEEKAWAGWRWMVRRKTFAHVLGIEFTDEPRAGVEVVLTFRAAGEELEMLRHAGPPFRVLGWGRDALGVSIDGEKIADVNALYEPKESAVLKVGKRKFVRLVKG